MTTDDYRDWYEVNIIAQITDEDIRKAAEVLNQHYGKENRIELEDLCRAIWGTYSANLDRKARDICEILTAEYKFPVGSSSGCSGRWRCRPDEIADVLREMGNRRASLDRRINAYASANFPPDNWQPSRLKQASFL